MSVRTIPRPMTVSQDLRELVEEFMKNPPTSYSYASSSRANDVEVCYYCKALVNTHHPRCIIGRIKKALGE